MPSIADLIAAYIRKLLEQNPEGVEIRRNELASKFNCAPSQITYVLTTRFGANAGFMVESRRGGGGYVRITRLRVGRRQTLLNQLLEFIGDAIGSRDAEAVIMRLWEEGFITKREALVMKSAVEDTTLRIEAPWRQRLRAEILKAMVTTVFRVMTERG
ncbi:MAG: CtsR family transcriptional regulator [Peptococcaceae bacterium]|nr:CtsR family transcriptional regulator [Peptococcaceae bacterium]